MVDRYENSRCIPRTRDFVTECYIQEKKEEMKSFKNVRITK